MITTLLIYESVGKSVSLFDEGGESVGTRAVLD